MKTLVPGATKKPSIVEKGDHEALIARGGAYAGLYEAQFSGPQTAAKGPSTT